MFPSVRALACFTSNWVALGASNETPGLIERKVKAPDLDFTGAPTESLTAFALHSPWVEILSLGNNGITSDDAVAVAVALRAGGALSMLRLHENSLQDEGAEAIAAALPNISGLRVLYLVSTGIGDAGARAVAAKLPECPALDFLDMSGNKFGEEAKEALRKACREHKPKIELRV